MRGSGAINKQNRDTETYSQQAIDYAHSEIHEGNMYSLCYGSTGTLLSFAFKTPNTAVHHHMLYEYTTESKAHFEILEGATWSVGTGSQLTAYNHNRSSSNTSDILEDTTGSFAANGAAAKGVVQIEGGTKVVCDYTFAANKSAGAVQRAVNERILKSNTQYVVQLVSDDASKGLYIQLDWYEHTPV